MVEKDRNQEINSNGHVRTLVVDDDPGIIKLFQNSIFVIEPGFGVQYAQDLSSALKILQESENTKKPIELMITDLNLKDHDQEGFSLIEEAKKRGVGQVILYSADGDKPEIIEKAWELGANKVIPKPTPLKNMRSTLQEVKNTIRNL